MPNIVVSSTIRIRRFFTPYLVNQITVFVLTFFGYASFHATRKAFSNVKVSLSEVWTPTESNSSLIYLSNSTWNDHHFFNNKDDAVYFLGILDTLFMISYAVGLYISGIIGDRYEPRKVLAFGMISTSIVVSVFGFVCEIFKFYNKFLYIILWILNGLLQSTGWPSMIAVMGNWFGKSTRGFILGMWSACASVGNIFGALMVSSVIEYGYEYSFIVTALFICSMGVLTYFSLVSHPKDIGLVSTDESVVNSQSEEDQQPLLNEESENASEDSQDDDIEQVPVNSHKLGFSKALCIPGVVPYSLAYASLKLVNYSFFFWLPFYLTNKYNWNEAFADKISIFYDVGGIVGGIVCGVISDLMGSRGPIVVLSLALSIPSLFIYSHSPNEKIKNAVIMSFVGFFIGAPSNLISSAISADLGQHASVAGNDELTATVTGIVDGTGSVGGAVGQLLVPLIELKLGWVYVFYLFIVMMFITIICVLPVLVKEISRMRCCNRSNLTVEVIDHD